MRIFNCFVIASLLIGCTKSDKNENVLEWGYLPSTNVDFSERKQKCSGRVYTNIPPSGADIGDRLYEIDEFGSRVSQEMYLGNSCIIASISTIKFGKEENQKFNHYKISVMIPEPDSRCIGDSEEVFCKRIPSSFRAWFDRNIPQENVRDAFKNKQIGQVIEFDEDSNKVVFTIGETNYEALLPDL